MSAKENNPIVQRSLANIVGILAHIASFVCAILTYGIAALTVTSMMGLIDQDPVFDLSGNDAGIAVAFGLFLHVMTIRVSIGFMHYAGTKFEEAVLWQHMIRGEPEPVAETAAIKKTAPTKSSTSSVKTPQAVTSIDKSKKPVPGNAAQPIAARTASAEKKTISPTATGQATAIASAAHVKKSLPLQPEAQLTGKAPSMAPPLNSTPPKPISNVKSMVQPGVTQDKQNAGLKVARAHSKPPISKKKASAASRLISFVLGTSPQTGSMPTSAKPIRTVNKPTVAVPKTKNA